MTELMLTLYRTFVALPGHIADLATSRFGITCGVVLGAAALLALTNAIVIPARERAADRRARRHHR